MWYPKSFASRLALSVLLTFGLIQVFLCALILVVREAERRHEFDDRIVVRAAGARDAIEAAYLRTGQLTLLQRAPLDGYHWQLLRHDGAVIQRAPSLGEVVLPAPRFADEAGEEPAIETWRSPDLDVLLGPRGALRIVSVRGEIPGEEPFIIQVGRDVEPLTSAIASLRRHLLIAVCIGLLLSGVASWVLASRVQSGIRSIVRQAGGITPEAPDRRIRPATGESELRELSESLNSMLDGLEQALRSREQFLADVSHELKAPLNALAAEARMMAAASRASDACRQLDSAVQSVVGALTRTADALLLLAQCSDGGVGALAARVALNEVVTDAVAHCLPYARPRSVRLIPMLPDETAPEPVIAGHADLLRITLENIVRNAVDYSPDGAPVRVVLASQDGHATVGVSDEGPGVSADLLPHVFERFVSARPTPARTFGHGLGLAIARRVVELHGGSIGLQNGPSGGCEVVIRLPLAQGEVTAAGSPRPDPLGEAGRRG